MKKSLSDGLEKNKSNRTKRWRVYEIKRRFHRNKGYRKRERKERQVGIKIEKGNV